MVVIDTDIRPAIAKQKKREIYLYKRANIDVVREKSKELGQHIAASTASVEDKWTSLKQGIENIMSENIPFKMSSSK